MLTYFAAGIAAGVISVATGNAGMVWLRRRGASRVEAPISPLEERVIQTIVPALEKASKDSVALTEQVRQFEARTTSYQNAITAQLGQMVTRGEVAEALEVMVSRPELDLALKSAAQQIFAAVQASSNGNGNGRALSALQEQVAGISQQLGMS